MRAETTWHRNAGARTYHLDAPNWVESGRAVCGASIARPYVYQSGPTCAETIDGRHEALAHYPRRYARVARCKRCLKRAE